jgi:lipopolysaccharide/colanic/teichoic acid biosynthesis glycosyltransferase
MRTKRLVETCFCLITAPIWLPLLAFIGLVILIFDGRPVFYVSERRVSSGLSRIRKFRTMIRNAERIANRTTIPVLNGTRFLNIPIESQLYTRVGRMIERCSLTELPQLFHVLTGKMVLIGNRPLPQNVVNSLLEVHPDAEDRFKVKAGLCGPVQLVGRTELTDEERLRIESLYCERVLHRYSILLDAFIFINTVLIGLRWRLPLPLEAVESRLSVRPVPADAGLGFAWPLDPEPEAEAS